jgi:bifunctional DNase/RNase
MTAYEELVVAINNDSDDDIKKAVAKLNINDGAMISHEMLERIAKALDFEVKEELPIDVKSDFYCNPIVDDSDDDDSDDDS